MKLSPEQFIDFVKAMDGDPEVAAAALNPLSWPDFRAVATLAHDQANDLLACDANLDKHARLMLVHEWAKARVE